MINLLTNIYLEPFFEIKVEELLSVVDEKQVTILTQPPLVTINGIEYKNIFIYIYLNYAHYFLACKLPCPKCHHLFKLFQFQGPSEIFC